MAFSLAFLPKPIYAETATTNINLISFGPIDQFSKDNQTIGTVDWANGVIYAIGIGVPPENATRSTQAGIMARKAATIDAYRNLAEVVNGVKVTAKTTVRNFAVENDVVQTKVSGLVKGARIIKEHQMPDGSYQVIMELHLYGDNGLAAALQDKQPSEILPFPSPSPAYASPARLAPVYTGVIIDARGLGLDRVMSPRIYDEAGRVVYGNSYLDPDIVVRKGMVDYAATPEQVEDATTGHSRTGAYPLIIKAIGLKDFNSNVVISQHDADMLLAANAASGFLLKTAVVFEQ